MIKDFRYAVRALRQSKGWTAVVVLSLALGIGANTALFSAINGLYLRKLPVRNPESLVRLRFAGRNDMSTSSSDYGPSGRDASGRPRRSTFSYEMFRRFASTSRTMTDVFACAPYARVNVVVDGRAELARGFITSGNYYRVLGLEANPGRTIQPEDDQPSAPSVAVISAGYWRSRFASDPKIVGRTVTINDVPATIVGVIAPMLADVQNAYGPGPDIAVPLWLDARLTPLMAPPPGQPARAPRMQDPTYWWLQVMGRLNPGVAPAQVAAELGPMFQQTARSDLAAYLASVPESVRSTARFRTRTLVPTLLADSGSRGVYDVNENDARAVSILTGVVVLVLLIVCANVANLLLSRAAARRREISIRLSLGATRARLIRQLLTESVLLSAVGAALAVVVARWSGQLLPGNAGQATAIDWRVLSFVLAVAVVTGMLFGIAPALRATSIDVGAALKETSRSTSGPKSRLGKGLLVVQVAISLVLLIAAGLFLRTLGNLRKVDVGFNVHNLVVFRVNPTLNHYDEKRIASLVEQLTERLQALPGVRGVAVSNVPLLANSVNSTNIYVAGRTYTPQQQDGINVLVISPEYFSTMQIPLVSGRGFTARDDQSAPKVAVINQATARTYFPNQDPIGMRVGTTPEQSSQYEIVGVLRDAKYDRVRDAVPPTIYVPHAQGRPSTVFHVRTAADPAAAFASIRDTVRRLDPNLPLMDLVTEAEQLDTNLAQERLFARVCAIFGALAMAVAAVGLFGLMSYSVARRTHEMGIRMALGAQRRDVVRLVLGESMVLVLIGLVAGVAIALGVSRFVASLLYGVPPTDPLTLVAAPALMVSVAAVAGYLPARRAAYVDPLVALHYE